MHKYDTRRDFDGQARLILISCIAVAVGALSTVTAWVLLRAIHFFTNLFFFQKLSTGFTSPASHTLGIWVMVVPVLGGLIIGLIARYGTLIEWANQLGLKDAVPLLQANLAEEEATDKKLTQLAKASANAKGKSKAA